MQFCRVTSDSVSSASEIELARISVATDISEGEPGPSAEEPLLLKSDLPSNALAEPHAVAALLPPPPVFWSAGAQFLFLHPQQEALREPTAAASASFPARGAGDELAEPSMP